MARSMRVWIGTDIGCLLDGAGKEVAAPRNTAGPQSPRSSSGYLATRQRGREHLPSGSAI
jgi:hypothetical protein